MAEWAHQRLDLLTLRARTQRGTRRDLAARVLAPSAQLASAQVLTDP
jgi:hypothetical protein